MAVSLPKKKFDCFKALGQQAYVAARPMPFSPLFPCGLRFTDITWSKGTHNISFKKWAQFRPVQSDSVFTKQHART